MPVCTDKESRAYLEGGIDALKWSLKYDIVLMDNPKDMGISTWEKTKEIVGGDYRFV